MSNSQTMLSIGTIKVGETVLPIYQFSQTEYAFSLLDVLQFLKIKNHYSSRNLKFFTAISTQTGLPVKFISVENFFSFLMELSQTKHHSQAMAILENFAIHGLNLCFQYFQDRSDALHTERYLKTTEPDFQVQPPSKLSDPDKFNIELKVDLSAKPEAESLHSDHLQQIKERNQELLNLLDEWNANPDYELDQTWDEVMASL